MTRQFQLTLTTGGTVYDLEALILADTAVAVETAADVIFPNQVCEVSMQANGGTLTMVDNNGNLGRTYADGDGFTDRRDTNSLGLSDYNVKGGTSGMKINVTIGAN